MFLLDYFCYISITQNNNTSKKPVHFWFNGKCYMNQRWGTKTTLTCNKHIAYYNLFKKKIKNEASFLWI